MKELVTFINKRRKTLLKEINTIEKSGKLPPKVLLDEYYELTDTVSKFMSVGKSSIDTRKYVFTKKLHELKNNLEKAINNKGDEETIASLQIQIQCVRNILCY